jgi:hypothetical protein
LKLKQSKNEKELWEVHKEFARNRTKKKIKTTRSMKKYRDKKGRKGDTKKQKWHLDVFKKEIGRETKMKIIKYEENLKK